MLTKMGLLVLIWVQSYVYRHGEGLGSHNKAILTCTFVDTYLRMRVSILKYVLRVCLAELANTCMFTCRCVCMCVYVNECVCGCVHVCMGGGVCIRACDHAGVCIHQICTVK